MQANYLTALILKVQDNWKKLLHTSYWWCTIEDKVVQYSTLANALPIELNTQHCNPL